ncbi:MAG: disulfide bond formation protein B [Hahellaceae bacterium]|nr:disulfide bond formation protein B [Hahellaceae bacterium]
MPWLHQYRLLCGLATLAIAGLMGFAFYLQYVKGLEPCPLCMAQRIAFVGVGLAFLLGWIFNPQAWGRTVQTGFALAAALAGAGLAARQVWLQHLPPEEVPGCGFGLDFMLDAFPLKDVIIMMITGTGDCAEIQWQFLGLTIAGWAFVAFAGFVGLAAWLMVERRFSKV